jgi:hypothetical protein
VVILEIPKLPEKEDEAVWPWLQFFKCKEREEFEMLAKKHPELKEAVSCVKKMSLGEQWRSVMLYRRMSKWKAWGEGHAEGLDEKSLEIARKMKGIGRPLPEIAEITGLSFETIERL